MNAEEYRQLMLSILKCDLKVRENEDDEDNVFYDGIRQGIRHAIKKLELSAFLTMEDK